MSIAQYIYRNYLPQKVRMYVDNIRGLRTPFIDEMDAKKIIFIHIPKAAGTSIANEIFCNKQPGHFMWSDYKLIDKSKYREYFKFSFVRNPYDRLVSAYFYLRQGGGNKFDKGFSNEYLSELDTFEKFVYKFKDEPKIKEWVHFVPQSKFIMDGKTCCVDFLGRFEHIVEDMNTLRDILKIPQKNSLVVNNSSVRKEYCEYYTKETRDIVFEIYKEDFLNFNYER